MTTVCAQFSSSPVWFPSSADCKTMLNPPFAPSQLGKRVSVSQFSHLIIFCGGKKKYIYILCRTSNIAVQFSLLIKWVCFNSHFSTGHYKMGIIRSQDVDLALGFLLVFDHKRCHNPQGRRKGHNHEKTTTPAGARRHKHLHKQFQRPNNVAGSPLEHERLSGFMCTLTAYDNCSLPGGGRPPRRVEHALHACAHGYTVKQLKSFFFGFVLFCVSLPPWLSRRFFYIDTVMHLWGASRGRADREEKKHSSLSSQTDDAWKYVAWYKSV